MKANICNLIASNLLYVRALVCREKHKQTETDAPLYKRLKKLYLQLKRLFSISQCCISFHNWDVVTKESLFSAALEVCDYSPNSSKPKTTNRAKLQLTSTLHPFSLGCTIETCIHSFHHLLTIVIFIKLIHSSKPNYNLWINWASLFEDVQIVCLGKLCFSLYFLVVPCLRRGGFHLYVFLITLLVLVVSGVFCSMIVGGFVKEIGLLNITLNKVTYIVYINVDTVNFPAVSLFQLLQLFAGRIITGGCVRCSLLTTDIKYRPWKVLVLANGCLFPH